MEQGKISGLVSDRGFGFITREGFDKDLFFHAKDVLDNAFDSLRKGDTVSFEVVEGPKGPAAVKIALVS